MQGNSEQEIRNRHGKLPAGKQACAFDSHDFTRIDEFEESIKYKCRKCGLEAIRLARSCEFDTAFFGSYIDNWTYRWKPDEMDVSNVVRLQVSFGDYPIRYIDYDRVTGSIRCENKINGSRDGGLRHPPGLFEPRVFQITDAQKEKLFAVLKAVDFSRWKTDAHIIENMRVGACGFFIDNSIRLLFGNGRSFVCYSCDSEDFYRITVVLEEICQWGSNAAGENTAEISYDRRLHVFPPELKKRVRGIITDCCNSKVPEHCKFCPMCGRKIKDEEKLEHLYLAYDIDQTMRFCECSHFNPFNYQYCANCGKKL